MLPMDTIFSVYEASYSLASLGYNEHIFFSPLVLHGFYHQNLFSSHFWKEVR